METPQEILDAEAEAEFALNERLAHAASKIKTEFVHPPIPFRGNDWCATFDGYEPFDLIGWGATEREAVSDLIERAYQ